MGWKVKGPSTIYAIRCNVNGKIYVGRTQDLKLRIRQHLLELRNGIKGGNPAFQDDFNQYGEAGFSYYILEDNVPPEMADIRESHWISEYRATNPLHGYNKLGGKTHDFKFTEGLPPKPN